MATRQRQVEAPGASGPVDATAEMLSRVGFVEKLRDADILRLQGLLGQARDEAEVACNQAARGGEPFGLDRILGAVNEAKLVLERIRVRSETINLLRGKS